MLEPHASLATRDDGGDRILIAWQVKRPYDDGEGPLLVSNEDVASPVGPQVSPKTESKVAAEILSNKGSIRELLDSKADTNVWLTPSFWSHPKWYSSAGMPESATESSGLCSPAPSEAPSAYSPHLASGPRIE